MPTPSSPEVKMQLSARNQLNGTVRSVELGLADGQPVTVFIKATEVLLGVE